MVHRESCYRRETGAGLINVLWLRGLASGGKLAEY